MFQRVLVAEDMDSINLAVAAVLRDLKVEKVKHAQYCDKAWMYAKRALIENNPYQLLICDLSFKADHRVQNITSGKELISLLKKEDPQLRILVHSVEDQPHTVQNLWKSGEIDGYVCKDRSGMRDLSEAIKAIFKGEVYLSKKIDAVLKKNNRVLLGDWDMLLLNNIANGLRQEEIRERLLAQNLLPASKSSIEKRLKELREEFGANTTPHLISILKDLNVI